MGEGVSLRVLQVNTARLFLRINGKYGILQSLIELSCPLSSVERFEPGRELPVTVFRMATRNGKRPRESSNGVPCAAQYDVHVDKRLRSDTFNVDDDRRTQRENEVSRVRLHSNTVKALQANLSALISYAPYRVWVLTLPPLWSVPEFRQRPIRPLLSCRIGLPRRIGQMTRSASCTERIFACLRQLGFEAM